MMERELPSGWEWKRLGDIVNFFNGYPFDSSKFNDEGRGCPVIRIRDLIKQSPKTFYDGEFDQSYLIDKGDILIGMDGEFNIVSWEGPRALLNQRNCKLTIKSDKILDGYLFRVLIKILKDIEDITPFVTVKHLSAKQLNLIHLPLPPLPIQRQIVAVLEHAEAVNRQRQEADVLTGALLQSVFRELFGDPVRNEKGWEKAKISDITVFHKQGLYTDVNYADDGIRLIRITDITEDGHLNYSSMPFLSINDKLAEQFKVEHGDFLFARSGVSIGRCAIVESNIPCVFGSFIIKFQFNPKKIDNKFFLYLMRMPINQYQLKKFTHGSANPNVNADNIKNLEIFVPPLALQQQFARVVQEVERIREQQAESKKEIDILFDGLMKSAFCGGLVA